MGLATNTLPASTNPPDDPSSSPITGGVIAGIIIGILAFLGLLGLLVWFLIRRKRRRQAKEDTERRTTMVGGGYDVDLGEGYVERPPSIGEDEGTVNPFRSEDSPDLSPQTPLGVETEGAMPVAGLAGLSGVVGTGSSPITTTGPVREPEAGGETSRQAGPLPPKPRSSIDRDAQQSLRIVNPVNPDSVPAVLPASTSPPTRTGNGEMRMRSSGDGLRQPTFRRHADAGRWRGPVQGREEEEVVDLPPLYTDINRDGDSEAGR